jgi:hypothetical protein
MSLRHIEEVTGVRRETASAYLKAVAVCLPGWGRRAPAKPAIQVTPDSGGKTGHSDPRLFVPFSKNRALRVPPRHQCTLGSNASFTYFLLDEVHFFGVAPNDGCERSPNDRAI